MRISHHTEHTATLEAVYRPRVEQVERALARRSVAMLATSSHRGIAHVAAVVYALTDDNMYVSTLSTSRKARNVARNPHVGVTVPVRRLPVGPPSTIQFQTTAELLTTDDPMVLSLAESGRLSTITSHGELDLPTGCVIRIPVPDRLVTYGLGMSVISLIRHPLDASGLVVRNHGSDT